MATYNTLTKGSTGADVKKLQQSLIEKGYDLGPSGADGKYGAKTQAAVTQYQKDNKLTVDGKAGKQTQGSLYAVPKTTASTTTTTTPTSTTRTTTKTDTNAGTTVNKENTEPSDGISSVPSAPAAYDPTTDAAYQSALATLLQVQQTTPVYRDSYSSQLQAIYDKIVNREKFSYDVNADAMYQQMKDQYIAGGKMAMQDTMGQAAAMNGGYGSSYAQSVGQQAYQGYMQQLNDNVPELYDRALAQYNQEGQDMLNQYAMLGDMADNEYQKYLNEMDVYYRNLDMARQDVETAYNRGYGAWRDSVGDSQWQQGFDHGVEQDEIGNQQWEESFEYGKEQDKIHNDQTQQQIDENIKQNEIGNERYEDELLKEEERNTKAEYYNRVMSFLGTDYTPTPKELYVAGITREQYDAMNKYATAASTGTQLQAVKSMSSSEIVEAMQGFSDAGDNTGLEAFLDDCELSGRMTPEQAYEYYLKYGTGLILTAPGITMDASGSKGVSSSGTGFTRPYREAK